ncbi:MAG: hypothetical protein LBD24_07235 [Spirochaetaceae bacterium]|jgi:hypothetical protein|nr:hypothetical protein [Spirochaetaceae bacterium]
MKTNFYKAAKAAKAGGAGLPGQSGKKNKKQRALPAVLLLLATASSGGAQDAPPQDNTPPPPLEAGTVPEAIRVPLRGEAPRYPKDTVIGVLGRGGAPEEAYQFARAVLNGALARDPASRSLAPMGEAFIENLFAALEPVNPRQFRIGGGREEADGSVSFLVRFAGREHWIAGELYLTFENDQWRLDDLILEEPRKTGDASAYAFDFSPYERFF